MPADAGSDMKARLRADLRSALKTRSGAEAAVLRAMIAAIDNAEAPSVPVEPLSLNQHQFASGSAEVERLLLNASEVRAVLMAEIADRERAAAEMERLKKIDRAEALRAEVGVVVRYLD